MGEQEIRSVMRHETRVWERARADASPASDPGDGMHAGDASACQGDATNAAGERESRCRSF